MTVFSLDEFKSSPNTRFSEGTWIIEYHDRSHLLRDTYIRLGKIEIGECTPDGNILFRFDSLSRKQLEKCIDTAWRSEKNKYDVGKAARIVLDQLSESMVRLGLMQPRFETEDCKSITERKFAVVILDTNALRNGAVRHLKEQFPTTQIWIIVPTVVLMEIGEKVANLKSRDKEGCKTKNIALIRSRPQVTIAPQAVKWIKENFPTETLELAPELLRAFRGYETRRGDSNTEPDRISINDRLILEGIKDLRRQRNLSEGVYLRQLVV